MRFIPILFTTEMAQAIDAGTKDVTRRLLKPTPPIVYQYDNSRLRWQPGDVLWVRETWTWEEGLCGAGVYVHKSVAEHYILENYVKWHPSIHMPKEASRLFLEVVSSRAERLHAITEDDAVREGVTSRASYSKLWDKINQKDLWVSNPWVARIEFKPIERPENF